MLEKNSDTEDLKRLGYAQELLREMGSFSNFALCFSVVSILTGISQLYGYGLQHGGPLQMSLGWGLVSIFTMTVALSMAELASAYPTAGALYHWSSFLGGRTLGWFTACFNSIGMFAILAGIDFGLAKFLIGIFGWQETQISVVVIYGILILSHAILNHVGIRIVSWLNDFSAIYHLLVVVVLVTALALAGFVQPVSFLFTYQSTDGFSSSYSFLIGLLLAQWTLSGYDASAHVSEETVDPRRKAPWGIFLAVTVSIIAGFVMLSAVTLSIPDLAQVTAFGDAAFVEICRLRLGATGGTIVALAVAGAMWLCGLATMTSASRMIYAFARDGGLPFSKVWAQVSPRFRTPAYAIWGLTGFATVLTLFVNLFSAVVSIATIALYISYGLPIAARLYSRMRHKNSTVGPWNLGKYSTPIALIALLWITVIVVIFMLPPNQQASIIMAGCLTLLVIRWTFGARQSFTGPTFHEPDTES
jgi:amino acid transporter